MAFKFKDQKNLLFDKFQNNFQIIKKTLRGQPLINS